MIGRSGRPRGGSTFQAHAARFLLCRGISNACVFLFFCLFVRLSLGCFSGGFSVLAPLVRMSRVGWGGWFDCWGGLVCFGEWFWNWFCWTVP